MLNNLLVFPLFLAMLPIQAHPYAHKAQQGTSSQQPPGQTSPSSPQKGNSPTLQDETKKQEAQDIRVVSTPPKNRYDWIAFGANLILVGVGIAGVVVAIYTLKKVERQTSAIEDQVRHMISSERAWLIVSSANREDQIIYTGLNQANRMYWWKVRNIGKSPAKILESQAVCVVSQADVIPLAERPNFPKDAIPYKERMLAPGDSVEFFTYWSSTDSLVFREEVAFAETLRMVAYGYVKYRTTVDSDIHESRFCDFCDHPQSKPAVIEFRAKLDAPATYTEST